MSALKQAEAARHDIAMAEQMRGLGKLDDARRIAARVLSSYPDHYAALHTFGLIEADRGNLDAALLALTKADAVLPDQPITMVALASVYLQMGSRAVAQRLIERVIAGGGGDSGACLTLGEIRREERDYEAALKAYDQALAHDCAARSS
jgi:tetratricopeptide (TPR) repeat protein